MSGKRCAREECGKTVYPIEELKCLDKVWHKPCFKCTVCGMTLNMKNYKGYDKKPYCEPHYPKTVASVMCDTPEMRRIAENTKNQSQVAYHAEYEKMKGTKIEIADDPEVNRHLKNSQVQSQVTYSGEMEKRKQQEQVRPMQMASSESGSVVVSPMPDSGSGGGPSPTPPMGTHTDSPYSARLNQGATLIYSSDKGPQAASQQSQRPVGSIADYDPLNGNWGTVGGPARPKDGDGAVNGSNGLSSTQGTSAVSPTGAAGFAVRAIYDYSAADKDEVSFLEGDVIVNCEKVDEGWMTGTVQRTLQWGMLPANYVQPHKIPTGMARFK